MLFLSKKTITACSRWVELMKAESNPLERAAWNIPRSVKPVIL